MHDLRTAYSIALTWLVLATQEVSLAAKKVQRPVNDVYIANVYTYTHMNTNAADKACLSLQLRVLDTV